MNTNVIHSRSNRGLSNNDNSGTSPLPGAPFTPNFIDLSATGPEITDFPLNPFERSNPLQTFSFLKNEEDTWRALGTITARMDLKTSPRHNFQVIAIGGGDYFNQENDFVSPPELGVRAQRRTAGTVVLSKSSNLNLNLAVNGNYTYPRIGRASRPPPPSACSTRTASSTPPASLGRTLLAGQENPDQAAA